jgi:uncharacterized protein YjbI with pentapeptide repeats
MDSQQQIDLLNMGVSCWNRWRQSDSHIRPDLSTADIVSKDLRGVDFSDSDLVDVNFTRSNLSGANLSGANLHWADLSEADLSNANLDGAILQNATMYRTRLSGARLKHADLTKANLMEAFLCADLVGATLIEANMTEANLAGADLSDAVLTGADLSGALLIGTKFERANLSGCKVYGTAVWDVELDGAEQTNLVLDSESGLTVEGLEVAQIIYLLLHNKKISDFIDTITSKAVLILGRFDERKVVLDALREELRKRDYLPILFDFKKPLSRDTDETITLLARMARFVIADVSNAKSVLHELRAIVPHLPSVPVQPIILAIQDEPGMFDFYRNMPWFLAVYRYADQEQLLADLGDKVIRPAELKVIELRG